ncbi:flagellar biosynthesis repressor FlbT [Paracoccus yeei]|uniref:flagellar biosynthesis repressor FlbT n=1 Tax=Paracoccus yeei TaxID=147645 RepID=UPI0009E02F7F|nr:flagellar biosynthesis repressor FlbT [Paracoccus yeei]OWJ97132.1 flagellar biosynthesis repressor FlbT [Paracoccus yeei]
MSGLVLKLAPNERVLINGAVIENGDRRSKISIKTPNANILRLRDAIHPNDACTPVARACYIAQLVLTGDASESDGRRQLLRAIEQLSHALNDKDSHLALSHATAFVLQNNYYHALKRLRTLLPREARIMASSHHDI